MSLRSEIESKLYATDVKGHVFSAGLPTEEITIAEALTGCRLLYSPCWKMAFRTNRWQPS